MNMKKTFFILISTLFGIIVGIFVLEGVLRIYNPFPSRIKGDKIYLNVSTKVIFENTRIPKLDKEILNSTNSLGFRGDEPPVNFNDYLTILTVGGSTTKCMFLSDDKTWPYLLTNKLKNNFYDLWLNNAGFDGHTTFGHIILLKDYISKLKPKVVLFLVGINDVGRDSLNSYDNAILRQDNSHSLRNYILKNSQLVSVILDIRRLFKLKRMGFGHQQLNLSKFKQKVLDEDAVRKIIEKNQSLKITLDYGKRIKEIISICRKNNIEPIFMTQPSLIGEGIDPITGINLKYLLFDDYEPINGEIYWGMLQRLNQITISVCKEEKVYLIDLANLMPKNSFYFYDENHFTNEGASKVAEIVYDNLKEHLSQKYSNFSKK